MTSNLSEGSCYFKPNIRDFKLLRRQEALSKIFRQQFKENVYCPVFICCCLKFTSRGTSRLNTEFKYTGQTGKKLELQFCWGDCQLNTQLITYWHLSWEISPAKLQQSFRNTLWDLFFFKIPKNITKRKNESLNQDTKKTKRSEKTKRKEVTMRKAESPYQTSSRNSKNFVGLLFPCVDDVFFFYKKINSTHANNGPTLSTKKYKSVEKTSINKNFGFLALRSESVLFQDSGKSVKKKKWITWSRHQKN